MVSTVSVVIPAYNSADMLSEALDSVLAQTFSDFELIIVDDGSTDNTREVVALFEDPRIRYVYQQNRGLSGARNTGIRVSRGRYVAFLDADDIWLPTKLAAQVELLDSLPGVGVVYGSTYWVEDRRVFGGRKARYRGNIVRPLLVEGNIVAGSGSSVMARRECFDEVGLFDTAPVHEDWDMWLRLAVRYEFDFVPEPLVKIRVHGVSMQKNVEKMTLRTQLFFDKVMAAPTLQDHIRPVRNQVESLAHFIVGQYCYRGREMGEARRYLLKSLKSYPLQGQAWVYLLRTLAGARVSDMMRATIYRLTHLLRYRNVE